MAVEVGVFCERCGRPAGDHSRFCGFCGYELARSRRLRGASGRRYQHVLPQRRILLMTAASGSLYTYWWFYVTWRHYRDFTGAQVFPIWHALTLMVPIYGLFRMHAHLRTYRDLMDRAGVRSTLSPTWGVIAILASMVTMAGLGLLSLILPHGALPALASVGIPILIEARLIISVQENLNRFWEHVSDEPSLEYGTSLEPAIAPGEVLVTALGFMSLVWGQIQNYVLGPPSWGPPPG